MLNLRKSINETLLLFAKKEDYEKLGSYDQLLNHLVLAVSHDLMIEFRLINEDAARSME